MKPITPFVVSPKQYPSALNVLGIKVTLLATKQTLSITRSRCSRAKHDQSTMLKMVWSAPMPAVDAAPGALRLDKRHAAQSLELATLARPGPFGERSLELGDYFGLFDGSRLVGMAGERMQAGGWREICGVCAHPEFEGRGLARSLVLKLVHRQWLRGQMPFLHVMRDNTSAHRLYRRLGFADARESAVRVVLRLS